MIHTQETEKIKALLNSIAEAPISLENFYSMCEDDWEENSVYGTIINNAEDLLEHARGGLFSNEVDYKSYRGSKAYRILLIDINLLDNIENYKDEKELIARRNILIKQGF